MTIDTTSVAPGWYKDPAGSQAMRWWDGNQWTSHLQPIAAPAAQPTQPAQPAQATQQAQSGGPLRNPGLAANSPTGYAGIPRNSDWGHDPYSKRAPASSVARGGGRVSNTLAWIGLVAGIVSIGTIFVIFTHPGGNYYLPFFGLTAIFTSARALARYRRGTVTVLWAPIVGLVLGVLAELIVIAGYVLVAATASTNTALVGNPNSNSGASPVITQLGPAAGSSINYSIGHGSLQYLPQANGMLVQAAQAESAIVTALKTDYGPGKYPTSLVPFGQNGISTSDGRQLGNFLNVGEHFSYALNSDGTFTLEISGPVTSEVAVYSSKTDDYWAWCSPSDVTCKTTSPVTPTD